MWFALEQESFEQSSNQDGSKHDSSNQIQTPTVWTMTARTMKFWIMKVWTLKFQTTAFRAKRVRTLKTQTTTVWTRIEFVFYKVELQNAWLNKKKFFKKHIKKTPKIQSYSSYDNNKCKSAKSDFETIK